MASMSACKTASSTFGISDHIPTPVAVSMTEQKKSLEWTVSNHEEALPSFPPGASDAGLALEVHSSTGIVTARLSGDRAPRLAEFLRLCSVI